MLVLHVNNTPPYINELGIIANNKFFVNRADKFWFKFTKTPSLYDGALSA